MKRIPISVHPFFWILAGLIGWLNSRNLVGTLLWMVVIFISVLFHELGHAITALIFKQSPRIELMAMGGVTTYENRDLKFWKQFLIVLNGPLFGGLLFLVATFFLSFIEFKNPLIFGFFKITQIVNLFWSVVNLLPVLPLDGGQLLRIALEGFFGVKGFRAAIFLGMCIALLLSVYFFIRSLFLIGAIFFLFAFQSFDSWRKSKFITSTDRKPDKLNMLKEGEEALASGDKNRAKEIFENIREIHDMGVLYAAATQYLALIYFEEGNREVAYKLLLEIKDRISSNPKCMLHLLAYEHKNYELVSEYSALCYQIEPSFDVAYKNAIAFASLGQAEPAGGWLKSAMTHKKISFDEVMEKEQAFERVKHEKDFLKFFKK